ncbi:peptidoglycan-binding protein [Frankia nepalensis]|uniref:peptidoglycan-binding protein n=1 Tax=Frankia nepalensis TaxID=1836974 RepID=UPI00288BD097|nr:peptidoglycan-binding protein [Frankia nepalensis]
MPGATGTGTAREPNETTETNEPNEATKTTETKETDDTGEAGETDEAGESNEAGEWPAAVQPAVTGQAAGSRRTSAWAAARALVARLVTPARRLPRRQLLVLAGAGAVALVVAAAVGFGGGSPAPPDGPVPVATATVERGTLTQTQQVGGLISYGEPVGLVAWQQSGVVTWIAAPGTIVKIGQPVYAVDGRPVILLRGTATPYRTLAPGVVGRDVRELEGSLGELGYSGPTVDDTFDAATASAVAAWQAASGLPVTGTVPPDQIFVHDGDLRVALQALPVGSRLSAQSNQQVITYSGTTQVASIPLDVSLQHLVHAGDPATVTLPTGQRLDGTVSDVGTVAQTIEEQNKTFVTVIVSFDDASALAGGFDSSPVTLTIVTGQREDVLTVPITALMANPDGGYAVQTVKDGRSTFVPVTAGLFANGRVEISGAGVAEGVTVRVAR